MLFSLQSILLYHHLAGAQSAIIEQLLTDDHTTLGLTELLAINTDGFIRYSAILEGNTARGKKLIRTRKQNIRLRTGWR